MRRHTNRIFLLSFGFHIVSILIVSSIFDGHFASAAVVEESETDVFKMGINAVIYSLTH